MASTFASTGSRSIKVTCTTGSESAPSAPAKAAQTVAFASAVAGNTVTIRGVTFTAIANGGTATTAYQFAVGAGGTADTDTGDAFAAAVNALSAFLGYSASNASGTVTLTALDYGTGPNAWTVAKTGAPITVGGAAFTGGVDIQGVNLNGVSAVRVVAEAVTTGQTLQNGNIIAYVLNTRSMRYIRWPGGDVAVGSTTTAGVASVLTMNAPFDYALWIPSGVTISSGNAVVYMDAAASNAAARVGGSRL